MPRVIRHEDTLFLAGGSNDVLRLYDDAGFTELVPLEDWRHRLAEREAFFKSHGIAWCLLLAPEKLSVLGDALLPPGSRTPLRRLREAVPHPRLVDPTAALRCAGQATYAFTDSHWLPLGAATAFEQAMVMLGIRFDPAILETMPLREQVFQGDLWDQTYADLPPDRYPRRALPDSVQRVHINGLVALKEARGMENEPGLHTGSHVVWRNPDAPRRERVVLFGSSFSEYRADCTLLSYLAAITFAEVHFVWSSNLDLDMIARIAPDIAVLEMPERFLTECPRDDFNLAAHEAHILARY